MNSRNILITSILIFLVFISSCTSPINSQNKDGTETRKGTLVLRLADHSNFDFEKVLVTISEVEVNKEGKWYLFYSKNQTFDLLKLKDISILLDQRNIEIGKYTQIRLLVTEAKLHTSNTTFINVKVPSDKIKLVKRFNIELAKTTELIIDIDLSSFVKTGSEYIMVPVVTILTLEEFEKKVRDHKELEKSELSVS